MTKYGSQKPATHMQNLAPLMKSFSTFSRCRVKTQVQGV